MRRARTIKDKNWCRYVYNVLENLTIEQRSELTNEELRHLVTARSIRRFAENINLEDQLAMLAKVGVRYALVAFRDKADLEAMIRQESLDPEVYAEKRLETLNKMREGHLFVLTNTNVFTNFNIAQMNSHHRAYIFNANYEKLLKHPMKGLDAKSHVDTAEETKRSIEAINMLSLGALAILENSEALFGVSTKYMKILLAAFQYQTDFVSRETLLKILGTGETPYAFSRVCGNMVEANLLIRAPHRNYKDPMYNNYTISQKGIEVVMKYMRYLTDRLAK